MMNQVPTSIGDTSAIEQAAIELWRQTKNDSSDWNWADVIPARQADYRRIAIAVLTAAGCLNGLRRGQP